MSVMPITRDGETFLTLPEAVTFLGVSRQTVYRLVQRGQLHPYKMGVTRKVFYRRAELERIAELEMVGGREDEEEE